MPRAKIVDKKPRGRMSAYAFFVQKCREEHKKLHPEESVVFSEFSKKCAEKWKIMGEEDKHGFYDMAKTDKERFDDEMANYDGPLPVRGGKKGKQKKDPNAPKRALSAFFCFSADERPKVRKESPELGIGDVAKEMGARWKVITPEDKAKYQKIADKDKERYAQELKAYKAGTFGKKVQKAQSESEEEEDEEMEDEDEDDE